MPDDTAQESWDLIAAPWHLDERIEDFPVPAGTRVIASPSLPAGSSATRMTRMTRMTRLYLAAADVVAQAARPLLLAGDCTTSLAAVTALQRRHHDIAVVWLDAHGDFNTPATTITGYLGGMALAMLTGRAPGLLSHPLGLRPVADHDVVLVDARDLDPAERDALAASHVRHVAASPDAIRAALSGRARQPVYLHVDVDVIDSVQLPGLRFPAGPGPGLARIEECLAAISATGEVAAACLACAWLPGHIGDRTTREAIARLAAAVGAQLTWPDPGLAGTRHDG